MSYRIAIPTHARADTLATKTLPTLARLGVDPALVDVYVAEPEIDAYLDRLPPDLYGAIREGAPGLAGQRNRILDDATPGEHLVEIDDDIDDVQIKTGEQTLATIGDLGSFIVEAFATLDRVGLSLWGVYLPPNAYFMRETVTTDLRYCCGGLFGLVADPAADWQRATLDDKEDFERTLAHYVNTGGVLRYGYVTLDTKYYTEPGGMQTTRTRERIRSSALDLQRRYPGLATAYRAKSGHWEVRLKDRR